MKIKQFKLNIFKGKPQWLFFYFMLTMSINLRAEHLVNLQVKGIQESALNDNVRIFLSSIENDDADGSERYQNLVTDNIQKALQAYGYYHSKVEFELQPSKASKKDVLIAKVTVGEPVRLVGIDVDISGQAQQDKDFQSQLPAVPTIGSTLNHETYDNYKNRLQQLAISLGYFDNVFSLHQLQVMPSTNQAWWKLQFDSGQRYQYDNIHFENGQIDVAYLQNMLNIKSDEFYKMSDLSRLTSNYSASGWFSSVLLQPKLQAHTKKIDLNVLLQPRKQNAVDLGIGYASDVGPRLQVGWNRPWINRYGHSLRSNLYLSSPKQTIEATYKVPLLKNPLDYYYEFSSGIENEQEKGSNAKTLAATVAGLRYWNNPTGWQYSVGVRARYDSFVQADVKDKTFLLYPTVGVNRTRLRGGLFPSWGDSQRIAIDLGRKLWLSDVDFFSIRATSSWIRTYKQNHRIYTRLELGWLTSKNFERLPPSLRFFAGGDRSVRGYGYKKISPKDQNGEAIGGSRLASASFEYQYQVRQDWWLATFIDAGLAANSFNPQALHYGSGMGIRWASPVGGVRFDIATPIHDKDKSKNIQFYIGLGTEL